MSGDERLERLLDEMRREFPRFKVIPKTESPLHRLIHWGLFVITFGQMRDYLEGYYTTLGQRLYVTSSWDTRDPDDRYITLCHERVHMRQFRKFTFPGMTLLYLLLPLPMGVAWFRAKFEMEAYAETVRAAVEVHGPDYVQGAFRRRIIRQFTGPSYGWMWPFRRMLDRWYDQVVEEVCRAA